MPNLNKLFALLFLSTGVFAIVSALFTWGEGWLFVQQQGYNTLMPWADLVLTGPLSLIAAYGIWSKKRWGIVLGSMTCGVYLYGSVVVYFQVFWQGAPYALKLLIPPVFGFGVVGGFLIWVIKNQDRLDNNVR